MVTKKNNKANRIIKDAALGLERNLFTANIITISVVYIGTTFWLNTIRATVSIWFLWMLIIIQLTLYFKIFVLSYKRAIAYGFNKNISIIIFVALAVLGRINDWQIIIMPIAIIIVLISSKRTKNVSENKRQLLPPKYLNNED